MAEQAVGPHDLASDQADARSRIRVGLWLATAFTAFFVACGWVAGASWYALRHIAASVRYGWRQGANSQRKPREGG